MKRKYFIFFIFFIFACSIRQNFFNKKLNVDKKLNDFFVKEFNKFTISFHLFNLDLNRELYNLNADQLTVSSSNIKLANMLVIYDILKSDYSPFVEIFKRGKILNEELIGNLIIRGNGAFFWGEHLFDKSFNKQKKILDRKIKIFIKSLNDFGIKRIRGKVICDSSNWLDGLKNPLYNAAGANIFYDNTIRIKVKKGKLTQLPSIDNFFIIEEIKNLKSQVRLKENIIGVDKNIDSINYWRLENIFSDDYFIKQLIANLRSKNFIVENRIIADIEKTTLTKILAFQGSNIGNLAKSILTYNDDLKAEVCFLQIQDNGQASYTYSSKIFTERINKILNETTIFIKDGSGLNSYNRLNTRQGTKMIQLIHKEDRFKSLFEKMAIAGKTGTLKKHFSKTFWNNNFRGIVSYLNGVVTLTGKFISKSKQNIAFSIVIDNIDGLIWFKLEKLVNFLEYL